MHKIIFANEDFNWEALYTIGGVSTLLQLVVILAGSAAIAVVGPRITGAEEFFTVQQSSTLASMLRGDFLPLILVGLYLGSFPALFAALWQVRPLPVLFATLFTVIAISLSFASESTFALLHLGDLYAAAGAAQRAQFLAAGEAVLAAGWWNSSSSYLTGILLQGSGVIISLVMLRSKEFRKLTAVAGLLGNGFDLAQHLVHPFAPSVSEFLTIFMAVYFIWYPLLAWDLFRLSKKESAGK